MPTGCENVTTGYLENSKIKIKLEMQSKGGSLFIIIIFECSILSFVLISHLFVNAFYFQFFNLSDMLF